MTDTASQLDALWAEIRSLRNQQAYDEHDALMRRLTSDSNPPRVSLDGVTLPGMGTSLGAAYEGNVRPFAGMANLLADPTFENVPRNAVTIHTTATAVGADWRAKYVLNSGTAPTITMTTGDYRSAIDSVRTFSSAVAEIFLANDTALAYDLNVLLYSTLPTLPNVPADFLVAALRPLLLGTIDAKFTTATAHLELVDNTSGAVVAGIDIDLTTLAVLQAPQLIAAIDRATSDFTHAFVWRLNVHVVKGAGAALIHLYLGEPQLHQALTPDPVPYSPQVSSWQPATRPETLDQNETLLAADTIELSRGFPEVVVIAAAAGRTMTSTPTFAFTDTVRDGHFFTLLNIGSFAITLQDRGTLANSALFLTAATIAIGPRQSLRFVYSADIGGFVQVGPLVAVL